MSCEKKVRPSFMHHRQPTTTGRQNPSTQFKSRQGKMAGNLIQNNQLQEVGGSLVGQQ